MASFAYNKNLKDYCQTTTTPLNSCWGKGCLVLGMKRGIDNLELFTLFPPPPPPPFWFMEKYYNDK